MKIEIKNFNELSSLELYEILQLRSKIFVVEQDCVYQDIDGKDLNAIHVSLRDESNKLVAYIRLLKPGVSYDDSPSIGRVICQEELRGTGYGKKVMLEGINYIINEWGHDKITISAQYYLEKFYSSLGFNSVGDVYPEDNIPHIKMIYKAQ